jgi:hypothetical protein
MDGGHRVLIPMANSIINGGKKGLDLLSTNKG